MIIGGRNDPEFGPVILCGSGGIFVEVYNDVAVRVAPINEEMARQMIAELKGAAILKGFRGRPPYDVEGLCPGPRKYFTAPHRAPGDQIAGHQSLYPLCGGQWWDCCRRKT